MPQRVIDAWDYFYYKQKMRRSKKIKVKEVKKEKNKYLWDEEGHEI